MDVCAIAAFRLDQLPKSAPGRVDERDIRKRLLHQRFQVQGPAAAQGVDELRAPQTTKKVLDLCCFCGADGAGTLFIERPTQGDAKTEQPLILSGKARDQT